MTNTQNTEEWEERFDEEFKDSFILGAMKSWEDAKVIKSFIRRERATAYKQGRKDGAELALAVKDGSCDQKVNIVKAEKEALVREMMEAVDNMKMDETYGKPEYSSQIVHNQALSDTTSTLRGIALKAGVKIK